MQLIEAHRRDDSHGRKYREAPFTYLSSFGTRQVRSSRTEPHYLYFSGNTKYFCVRMLRSLLRDYPENVIHRSAYCQYGKKLPLYNVTFYEVELLNRINSQHARHLCSQHPLTAIDHIVRVSDFLPFYEYLCQHPNAASATLYAPANTPPQPRETAHRLPLLTTTDSTSILRTQLAMPPRMSVPSYTRLPLPNHVRENIPRMAQLPVVQLPPSEKATAPYQPASLLSKKRIACAYAGNTFLTCSHL